MKPMPASIDRMKHAATMRSADLALRGSSGSAGSSRRAGREPDSSSARSPSSVRGSAGGGVPITRCGPARGSAGSSGSPLGALGSLIGGGLPVLRSYPHGGQHHEEQQAEEYDQALGHRPDPAQAEA